jgi:hypothetical protein
VRGHVIGRKYPHEARPGAGKRPNWEPSGETESVPSPDLHEENNFELPMQRRRLSALKMSAWLGLYGSKLRGSSTRTFLGISDSFPAGTPYVGELHGGKKPGSGCCPSFWLGISDQIGKLIHTAGMKLACPVAASADTQRTRPWTLRAGARAPPRLGKNACGRSPDQNGGTIVSDDHEDLTSNTLQAHATWSFMASFPI